MKCRKMIKAEKGKRYYYSHRFLGGGKAIQVVAPSYTFDRVLNTPLLFHHLENVTVVATT